MAQSRDFYMNYILHSTYTPCLNRYARLNGRYEFKLTPTNDVRQGTIGPGGLQVICSMHYVLQLCCVQRVWIKADEGHTIPGEFLQVTACQF